MQKGEGCAKGQRPYHVKITQATETLIATQRTFVIDQEESI